MTEKSEGPRTAFNLRGEQLAGPEELERPYQALVDNALVGVLRSTLKGEFLYANQALVSMLGHGDLQELYNVNAIEIFAQPRQRQKFLAQLKARGRVSGFEAELQTKDGETRTVLISASLEGEVLEGTLVDITERKRAEEEVAHQNQFLKSVIESLPHPFVVINVNDYKVEFANPAARRGGLEESQFCYTAHRSDMPCSGSEHVCPISEIKKTRKHTVVEHLHYDKDNNRRHVEIFAYPIFDEDGSINRIIEHSIDITDRKRAEEAIRRANEELERLNQLKDELVSDVTHDLKTPLVPAAGFLDIVLSGRVGPLTEKQKTFLTHCKRAIVRQANMVEDLLDATRIKAGRLRFEPKLLDVRKVLSEALQFLALIAPSREVRVESQIAGGPLHVHGEARKLERIFMNLFTNAVGHSPKGGRVTVRAWAEGGRVLVSVQDTGAGIAAEEREKIFERYYQGNARKGGSGLGLSIVKEFVRLHGGEVKVDSEPGKGSTFFVELPLASQPATGTEDAAPS
jgi:PAS domain S-box-containing protein